MGLTIVHLLAEYRALRSSVLRLWMEQHAPGPGDVDDIGRFNEAMDQAIAESVRAFALETENRRQLFLAALGHDLRNPLNAVALTAQAIALKAPSSVESLTQVLSRSAQRLSTLLDSLLEFNLAGLGGSMKLHRASTDLERECEDELAVLQAAFPQAAIQWEATGECRGSFDASRVREALANLVSNAAKYGTKGQPVNVRLHRQADQVRLTVSNAVEHPMAPPELELLFQPLRRGQTDSSSIGRSHLGLGLFITREIAKAHGGQATARFEGCVVHFTVVLPVNSPP